MTNKEIALKYATWTYGEGSKYIQHFADELEEVLERADAIRRKVKELK